MTILICGSGAGVLSCEGDINPFTAKEMRKNKRKLLEKLHLDMAYSVDIVMNRFLIAYSLVNRR